MTPQPFTMQNLVAAWRACERHKATSASARAFRAHAERNLFALRDELLSGAYRPGPSVCFVVTRPKLREVWAASFPDRVVHWLLYNHIAPRFYRSFITNSCACIPGRGTLFAAQRLEAAVRSVTHNWARPAFYLKMDLANFFVAVDKPTLLAQLTPRLRHEPWWLALATTILLHDPRPGVQLRGDAALLARVPPHKSLFNAPADRGLPIGNLSSQFFANVHLDALDQMVVHRIKPAGYVRYVDDFVLLAESSAWLGEARERITTWLPQHLGGAQVNPTKTILQPVDRGVDFVGQVVKPWHRSTRRRTVRTALHRIATLPADQLLSVGNSYLGQVGQATAAHQDRAVIAGALMKRGMVVKGDFSKAYRGK